MKKREKRLRFFIRYYISFLGVLFFIGAFFWSIISMIINSVNNGNDRIMFYVSALILSLLFLFVMYVVYFADAVSLLSYDIYFDNDFILCRKKAEYKEIDVLNQIKISFSKIKYLKIEYRDPKINANKKNKKTKSIFIIYLVIYDKHNNKHKFYIGDFTEEYLLQIIKKIKEGMRNNNNFDWEDIDEKALVETFIDFKTNFKTILKNKNKVILF